MDSEEQLQSLAAAKATPQKYDIPIEMVADKVEEIIRQRMMQSFNQGSLTSDMRFGALFGMSLVRKPVVFFAGPTSPKDPC